MTKDDLLPVITQEECAEVIQAISKVYRFGLHQVHPETGISNKLSLETEVGQLEAMLREIRKHWNLNESVIYCAQVDKQESLTKWSQFFPNENI
jgi:NTP pyrophosphatase (non-canonical NTP hydrolase)